MQCKKVFCVCSESARKVSISSSQVSTGLRFVHGFCSESASEVTCFREASIPAASTILSPFTSGQNLSNPGQIEAQPGQPQDLTKVPSVEEGTENALQLSNPGSTTSIISAPQKQNLLCSEIPPTPDLAVVIEAWDGLPETVREAILLLVIGCRFDQGLE